MRVNRIFGLFAAAFGYWFHKRNIIIVSEYKVKHVPIGGKMQFALFALIAGAICWASYSTGSYMAARTTLRAQNRTLRSVANAHIEKGLKPLFQINSAPIVTGDAAAPVIASLTDPMFTLSALQKDKLSVRIAYLEHTVEELKNANETIIQRVNEKTVGDIQDLESIIKNTGLNSGTLKKQASENTPHADDAQGGPFIPDNTSAEMANIMQEENEMEGNLDKLTVLRQIVGGLPLASPIDNPELHSTFGRRIDPFNGHMAFHSGLDLAGPTGAPIHSTAEGKVISAGVNGAYGNCIEIDHGFGITTRYGHLSAILVKEGQLVHKGDVIGIQGSTGRSTGPHLHYEVRYHDQAMNPENFLNARNHVSKE